MNYFDILLAKKLSGGGVQPTPQIVDKTVKGNPLNFITQFAQLAKETVISLAPIQDLHGYDYPWPAGGGKNKADSDGLLQATGWVKNSDGSYTGSVFYLNYDKFNVNQNILHNFLSSHILGKNYTISFDLTTDNGLIIGASIYNTSTETSRNKMLELYQMTRCVFSSDCSSEEYVSSFWFSFNTQKTITISNLQFEEGSTATSYAPYANECPIDGRTETSLVGCGKNQLDISTLALRDVTGTGIDRMSFAPQKLKAGKWTFSFSGSQIMYITNVSDAYSFEEIYESPYILTANGNDTYMIRFAVTELSHITNTNFQLEYGEQATDYEPYHESNNLTIYFGEKVYGATVELEKGTVTVDREIVDLGTLTWTISSSLVCRTPISDKKDGIGTLVSSSYKYEPNKAFSTAIGEISDSQASSYAKNIFVKDPRVTSETTASQFASMVSGQQVCYPLATPRTITLAPNEISLLEGVNNISIDDVTGEITLTYKEIEFA